MVNDSDLCVNLKDKGKSTDFQAMVDVSIKDFSAISYLLFKHGNQIQQRLSKAVQAFFYKQLITMLIILTYMISSGFSAAIPFLDSYYFVLMLFLGPAQILVFAVFYRDYGNEYFYRIFGHYKYNFSFVLVEPESVIGDFFCIIFDWLVIYIPHEMITFNELITTYEGRTASIEAYNCY